MRALLQTSQPDHRSMYPMQEPKPMPVTRNEAWGFSGVMTELLNAAWPLAMTTIANATLQPLEAVRSFLDSRFGRHFGNDVYNALCEGQALQSAIHHTTQRWMHWPIGQRVSKQYGIPKGLPYLTGFVIHCEVVERGFSEQRRTENELRAE